MHPDNPIPTQLANAAEVIRLVARREIVCCAFAGGAGLGKTRLTEQVLRKARVRYGVFRGSGPGLTLEAYRMRTGGVIVLDDADNLVTGGGAAQANTMKMLLAPAEDRVITSANLKNRKNDVADDRDENVVPSRFITRVGIVWLTNETASSAVAPRLRVHMQALTDRGLMPVELSDDPRWKMDYVLHLVLEEDLLVRQGLKRNEINDVLEFFVLNARRLQTISIRAIEQIARLRHASERWHSIASSQLLSEPRAEFERPLTPPRMEYRAPADRLPATVRLIPRA